MRNFLIISIFLVQTAWCDCLLLDLETAWERIVSYAPSIAAIDAEIDARVAVQKQVSVIPNPVVSVEADDIGVCRRDDNPAETVFAVSQLIELGGKRGARTALASSSTAIAYWDSQIARCDLRSDLTIAFINISIAQERWQLAQQRECIAADILQTIRTKVAGGKISPIQIKQAQIALKKAQICTIEACTELSQAKRSLSLMWGCPQPDFDGVVFELYNCLPPLCYESIFHGVCQTPDFARAQAAIFSAEQNIKLQRANSIPDVNLTVGYGVVEDSDQNGWLFEINVPLPLFDRNQGNLQRAHVEKAQAEFQLEEVERGLQQQALLAYEGLIAFFEESEMIKHDLLIDAMDAVNLIQMGYQNGKFEYLELLEAQNALFDIQHKYLETLYNYHLSRVGLERLTGQFI